MRNSIVSLFYLKRLEKGLDNTIMAKKFLLLIHLIQNDYFHTPKYLK